MPVLLLLVLFLIGTSIRCMESRMEGMDGRQQDGGGRAGGILPCTRVSQRDGTGPPVSYAGRDVRGPGHELLNVVKKASWSTSSPVRIF